MANKEEWRDPCGNTNYKDEDHRDERYENGKPPKYTGMEFTTIERIAEMGTEITETDIRGYAENKSVEADGKAIMDGSCKTIRVDGESR